ncbi:hypothetical protein ILYODFUR_031624, partial [Ilyodon furcidens]
DVHGRKQQHRYVTIYLGLVCTLLLAGNIGQVCYYRIYHPASSDAPTPKYNALTQNQNDVQTVEIDRSQSEQNALFVEKHQLEVLLRNLTEYNEQLQQSYRSLTAERDKLGSSLENVTNNRNQLQANYSSLKSGCGQSKTSYEELQRSFEDLQSGYYNLLTLLKGLALLSTKYKNMQRKSEGLLTQLSHKVKRDQLECNCSLLWKKDQLQEGPVMLNKSKIQIETTYSSLWKKKELFQTSYDKLMKEKEDLQTRGKNLTNSTDPFKTINQMTELS